jgi:hypothetical protein
MYGMPCLSFPDAAIITVTLINGQHAWFNLPPSYSDGMDILVSSNASGPHVEFYWKKIDFMRDPQARPYGREVRGAESTLEARHSGTGRQMQTRQTARQLLHRRQTDMSVEDPVELWIAGPRNLYKHTATWRVPSWDVAAGYIVIAYGTYQPEHDTYQSVQVTLRVVHPCDNNACGTHGTCARMADGSVKFNCTCDAGWSGMGLLHCRLIAPAASRA